MRKFRSLRVKVTMLASLALACALVPFVPVAGAHEPDQGVAPTGGGEERSGGEDHGRADRGSRSSARLSGLNGSPVADPDGSGRATVRVRGAEVCWKVRVNDIGEATAAHIHKGAVGASGPIVVDFEGKLQNCKTVDPDLAQAIAEAPGDYYVNVHNGEFPAGAIRGQLVDSDTRSRHTSARLNGANETPAAGDPDGRGTLRVDITGTLLCWDLRVRDLAPTTAAHIHKAAAGSAGPVVVDFANRLQGCRDVVPALASAIIASPDQYYGNVHTGEFPAGAIRGQLR